MPTAEIHTVTVHFNPNGVLFSFDNDHLPGTTGGQGYVVHWELADAASNLQFAEPAILWHDNETPPPLTEDWTLPDPIPAGPQRALLNDQTSGDASFGYRVAIVFNNNTIISADPELVLQPPG